MIPPGRVLAIDYGSRRLGLAVSDPLRLTTTGLGALENTRAVLARLAAIAAQREATLIVVGMPYAPDGGLGKKGDEVAVFVHALRAHVGVPVETWDESFSTRQAGEALRTSGTGRKKRRERWRVDEMAARILLQDYLEHHGTA